MAATCIDVPVTSHTSSIASVGLSRSIPIRALMLTHPMLAHTTAGR